MARTIKFAALAAALMLTATVVGASAFTNAKVDRAAHINVANDANGVLELAPGATGTKTVDGKLTIVLNNLNQRGSFMFGNDADAQASHAFSISTRDSKSRSVTLSYTGDSGVAMTYEVYDGTNTLKTSATATTDGNFSLPADGTYYVVIKVNTPTTGVGDFTGTLTITAN